MQSNLFLDGLIFLFKPDLTIPLTLYIGLSQNLVKGGLLVLWIGFLLDVFSGSVMGMYVLIRGFMFFLIQFIKKGFFLEKIFLFTALVVFLFFVEVFFVFLMLKLTGKIFFDLEKSFQFFFAPAFFTLLIWYLVYPVFSKLENIVKRT